MLLCALVPLLATVATFQILMWYTHCQLRTTEQVNSPNMSSRRTGPATRSVIVVAMATTATDTTSSMAPSKPFDHPRRQLHVHHSAAMMTTNISCLSVPIVLSIDVWGDITPDATLCGSNPLRILPTSNSLVHITYFQGHDLCTFPCVS